MRCELQRKVKCFLCRALATAIKLRLGDNYVHLLEIKDGSRLVRSPINSERALAGNRPRFHIGGVGTKDPISMSNMFMQSHVRTCRVWSDFTSVVNVGPQCEGAPSAHWSTPCESVHTCTIVTMR